jgi:hypothetical protein
MMLPSICIVVQEAAPAISIISDDPSVTCDQEFYSIVNWPPGPNTVALVCLLVTQNSFHCPLHCELPSNNSTPPLYQQNIASEGQPDIWTPVLMDHEQI